MISRGPARFDPAELESLNARLLHAMPYEMAQAASAGVDRWRRVVDPAGQFAEALRHRALGRDPRQASVQHPPDPADTAFLAEARELLPPEPWDETTWSAWTNALKAKSGRKGRALFHPLRLALTGREDGPELKSLLPLLGRKACLDRLS